MKFRFLLLMAVSIVAVPTLVSAAVTLKQTNVSKGLGMSAHVSNTTFIKGDKMRINDVMGDKTETTIFDLDTQKAYFFNSEKKQADVWNMQALAQNISKSIDEKSIRTSIKPNGHTKKIAGRTANGYDIDITIKATTAGSQNPTTVTLQGTTWIVKGAPGTADFKHFYRTAADKGWIFTNPHAAKAQPGEARAMDEMYRKFAELGGIPYETDIQIQVHSSGLMGALFSHLGNISSSSVVDAVSTGALADSLFTPPSTYKLNPKH